MTLLRHIIFLLLLSFFCGKDYAAGVTDLKLTANDSADKAVKKLANKRANRASLMSAILPGLGQVYNRRAWKVPIIYAGLGAFAYFAYSFNNDYNNYHHELLNRYKYNLAYADPAYALYTNTNINTLKSDAKRYRDFCIIGLGIVYVLNVIDANVDAHFKTFDMNDNLSLTWRPKAMFCLQGNFSIMPGISLTLNFK